MPFSPIPFGDHLSPFTARRRSDFLAAAILPGLHVRPFPVVRHWQVVVLAALGEPRIEISVVLLANAPAALFAAIFVVFCRNETDRRIGQA
jgi:hypothetical protein